MKAMKGRIMNNKMQWPVVALCSMLGAALLAGCGDLRGKTGAQGPAGQGTPMATITGTVVDPVTGNPTDVGTVAAVGWSVVTRSVVKGSKLYRATRSRGVGAFSLQVPTGNYMVICCSGDDMVYDTTAAQPITAITAGQTYPISTPLVAVLQATLDTNSFTSTGTSGTNCSVLVQNNTANWTFTLPNALNASTVDTWAANRFVISGNNTNSLSGAYLTTTGTPDPPGSLQTFYVSNSTSNSTTFPSMMLFSESMKINSLFAVPAGSDNANHIQLTVTNTAGGNILVRSDLLTVYQIKAGDSLYSLTNLNIWSY